MVVNEENGDRGGNFAHVNGGVHGVTFLPQQFKYSLSYIVLYIIHYIVFSLCHCKSRFKVRSRIQLNLCVSRDKETK